MIISFPEARRHAAKYLLYKKNTRILKSLGFRFYNNKDKLIAFLPFSNSVDVGLIRAILARITFDVFYFKEFEGGSFIRLTEGS